VTAETFRRGCARCDWSTVQDSRAEARAALETHAADAAHPLCSICRQSLSVLMEGTCMGCVGRVRAKLRDAVEMFALLPGELVHDRGAERALVMLSPGGYGTSPTAEHAADKGYPWGAPGRRRLPAVWVGDGWVPALEADPWKGTASGLAHPGDPESIAQTLGQWEDGWRTARAELAADTAPTVATAAAYLLPRLSWAGEHHYAFADFADDVRRIHRRLEDTVAWGERPEYSDAPCFDCGALDLRREYGPARVCHHPWPPRLVLPDRRIAAGGVRRLRERRRPGRPVRLEPGGAYRQRMIVWKRDHPCEQGGRADNWECGTCGRAYAPESYWLALRAWYEDRRVLDELIPSEEP
jgi:hypothetical protein